MSQGSDISPVLFLIHFNSSGLDLGCKWVAFADDFKLCVHHPMVGGSGAFQLQVDLDRV